ncbi:MAG: type II secretion system GspH family protein [Patescibacteria group bacterium]|nr:type II secretion system GspH family protein [Patescibacteria group bacterium]
MKAFTIKRAEQQESVHACLFEAIAERKAVLGFTLVETMIAVTIVTLAVSGPLFSASRAIVAAQTARTQLTASYLAQEGIEYVRRMRDNEYLAAYRAGDTDISSTAWVNFLNNPSSDASSIFGCRAPKVCTLDPAPGNASPVASCPGNSCSAPLYILSSGIYSQQNAQGSTITPFVRSIQAVDVSANDEQIISTVSWSYHGIPYSVTVTDHLTPWQ